MGCAGDKCPHRPFNMGQVDDVESVYACMRFWILDSNRVAAYNKNTVHQYYKWMKYRSCRSYLIVVLLLQLIRLRLMALVGD